MGKDTLKAFADKIAGVGKGKTKTMLAATVVFLRDRTAGLETLMLRKTSKIAFGGMWVFPGGRIDAGDGAANAPADERARFAAVREAQEEAALVVNPDELVWFSHWTPPALGNPRFITWFFAARAPDQLVTIDDGEITDSQWLHPGEALKQQREGKIEVVPPTYVTLHYLSQYRDVDTALTDLAAQGPSYYTTRIGTLGDELVAMWEGDAGYESGQADTPGSRHRLIMAAGGWRFEDTGRRRGPG
jgi:8-oxo-dGTP pyrophosphatase MutT (NUDIX family)